MTEEGKYIYSIIKEDEEKRFGSIGLNNRDVYLIRYQDLAAVVSNTPVINFDHLRKDELTKYIEVHQKVNETLLASYDVVPMAFGVIAGSQEELLKILEKAYLQFKGALEKIRGKVEFVIQASWNEKDVLAEISSTNPEIQKLKKEAESRGKILGMPAKLKLGKLVFEALGSYKKYLKEEIRKALGDYIIDSFSGKLLEKDMVLNLSILIDISGEGNLDKTMEVLGETYKGKLRFKYIGPMPPCDFVNINLSLGNFEVVDKARSVLVLGEAVSPEEIKKTYRELSHKYHPDMHEYKKDEAVMKEMAEKMKELTDAYHTLSIYCSHYLSSPSKKNEPCSLKKEDVENSLIIR